MTEEEAERALQQPETIATTPIDPGSLKTVVDIQNSFQVSLVAVDSLAYRYFSLGKILFHDLLTM